MFNSLWGLTPKPSTTPESFSASMSMAVGSAGLQTVLVQVWMLRTYAAEQLMTLCILRFPASYTA